MIGRLIDFCLQNKLVVFILLTMGIIWGVIVAPFDWKIDALPRDPVPVDAIPDIGENQQIVFTEWMGRSPQDVDDQISYPLTAALLGVPKVKTIRTYSYLGFSAIYLIFEEDAEFYWSRSRILEKLNSLPPGTLPPEVSPALGPDATALGQVFWYTLEGRTPDGEPASGWDPQELRSIQDYYVRYGLQSVDGVAEVASIGGFQQEYQVDVDPDAMRAYGITLDQVFQAVRDTNIDVGARTIEINRVEYVIRGRGFIENLDDLRRTVVMARENTPITLQQIATIERGPALRRGALDKAGAEAVGGVVVARYGANPMATINHLKEQIAKIAPGLPEKTLDDGTVSKVTIVPFYDRSVLIGETLDTLNVALFEEILVTIIVVLLLVFHLRSSGLIALMLPLAVLFTFIAMKVFGVDANVVALSGIAIAIGTIVDMGIVVCENILNRIESERESGENLITSISIATKEVGGAVMTAVLTTVIGFLPVFAMEGAEGKLFRPLAFTKTFALVASILIALTILPSLAHILFKRRLDRPAHKFPRFHRASLFALALVVALVLAGSWQPLGPAVGLLNHLFVILLVAALLGFFWGFTRIYPRLLAFFLSSKLLILIPVACFVGFGGWVWSNLGKEFMPSLDEGSFLYMPTVMPHASIGEATEVLAMQDMAIRAIPEVDQVVGKIGRVDSPLDPAPVSMVETVISYKPEFGVDDEGNRVRNWRDEIQSPQDIWDEIVRVAQIPGSTSAPKLQPIETRLVMLATGMRAPMGMKVYGPDLETIEKVSLDIEALLKEVPDIRPETVFADRVVGKPYQEIAIDRDAIARYGISIRRVQDVIEVAIGGRRVTTTVEGRERYPVRVRYQRELRDSIEDLTEILVPAPDGTQIPLGQLAKIEYVRGPQAIKSEDTFLTAYVIFDRTPGVAEVSVVEEAEAYLEAARKDGRFTVPPGVSYKFTGSYENQVRAEKKLAVVMPVALAFIFLILYFQFGSVVTTLLVFSGVFVAGSGGFMMIWFYNQPWFLDATAFGVNFRDLFQINGINLSVAVWVGFLALFGIATDDGVLMGTFIKQRLEEEPAADREALHARILEAAQKRIRPAMMTTATTVLALLPVLTSTGRGSDIMVPMAIPSFGGMTVAVATVFVVPVLYCWVEEIKLKRSQRKTASSPNT